MKVPGVKLPKVKLKDLDWKWALLLVFMMFITVADDPTVIGEVLDPIEIPLDALVAMILQRKAMQRAAEREGVIIEGRVVKPGDPPTATDGDATQVDTVPGRKRG